MSSAYPATDLDGAARKHAGARRFTRELAVRAVYGALLAIAAIVATLAGGYVFAAFVAIASIAAVREWHRMVGTSRFGREAVVASAAVVAAIAAMIIAPKAGWAFAVLGLGALSAALAAATRRAPPVLGGFGTLYIGVPACSLVILRGQSSQAQWIVLGVFLTIWTADTGALLVGKLLGGPKLLPLLSPNKTWAGLCGGLILPAVIAAIYVSAFGGIAWRGFAAGFALAAAGHLGDLFESWIKRRVGRKNSGNLIPGHGGILDRVDSTLFAVPLAAAVFHFVGAAQLFGVTP